MPRVRSNNPWSKDNNLWQGCIQQYTHTRALWADCHSPYTSLSFKTRCYSSRIGRGDRSSWARQAFGYNPPPWYYESFLCRGPSAKGSNCHLLVHTNTSTTAVRSTLRIRAEGKKHSVFQGILSIIAPSLRNSDPRSHTQVRSRHSSAPSPLLEVL